MKKIANCSLFLLLGIAIGMNIPSVGAFTDEEFQTLQKQVNSLNARLDLLQTAFNTNAAGTVTIKGTSITIQASGLLSLKGTPVKTN